MGFIDQLFYQGQYAEVLEKTYEDQSKIVIGHMPYIIGSLSFLGRVEEADAFFLAKQKSLSPVQKSYGHFFLSIAWTRRSHYKKARRHLKENQQIDRLENFNNAEIRFLVSQGISFFLYYFGQFQKSLTWSQKSLNAAMAIDNFWMKALSLDLLANNLIQNGRIFEGLSHFKQAIKFSNLLKNQALVQAMETSHLIFRCEYGIEIEASFKELNEKFRTLTVKDSFSKANLGLELARQLTLRGQYRDALATLDLISPYVYQSQNRRQEARLNLRWAECYFQKNELSTALHYIRSGKKSLEFVDQTYEIQFLGLEIKTYKQMQPDLIPTEQQRRLDELSTKFKTIMNENMISRQTKQSRSTLENSGDEIHLLLQKAESSEEEARKIILRTGFYSWIPRFLNVQKGQNYILLNLESKSITCLDSNGISHKPQELSTLNYKILTALSKNFKTKEELLETIWGYEYDPLRHDSLIYSAFSNLRKILGDHSWLLETSETGYQLKADMLEISAQKTIKNKNQSVISIDQSVNFTMPDQDQNLPQYLKLGLNSRQIQILQYFQHNQFIAVKIVQDLFSISEITANRDLRALLNSNLVVRVGQGRATRYMRSSK
ncbi:MAG: DeoR family transcriptional regulator [Bdellovibrio sp.]|nr:DeoR family transcriptional regulator [Bdellovibrio sp.]